MGVLVNWHFYYIRFSTLLLMDIAVVLPLPCSTRLKKYAVKRPFFLLLFVFLGCV